MGDISYEGLGGQYGVIDSNASAERERKLIMSEICAACGGFYLLRIVTAET